MTSKQKHTESMIDYIVNNDTEYYTLQGYNVTEREYRDCLRALSYGQLVDTYHEIYASINDIDYDSCIYYEAAIK